MGAEVGLDSSSSDTTGPLSIPRLRVSDGPLDPSTEWSQRGDFLVFVRVVYLMSHLRPRCFSNVCRNTRCKCLMVYDNVKSLYDDSKFYFERIEELLGIRK